MRGAWEWTRRRVEREKKKAGEGTHRRIERKEKKGHEDGRTDEAEVNGEEAVRQGKAAVKNKLAVGTREIGDREHEESRR